MNCPICGGLIMLPGVTYGYAGPICPGHPQPTYYHVPYQDAFLQSTVNDIIQRLERLEKIRVKVTKKNDTSKVKTNPKVVKKGLKQGRIF